MKRRKFFAFFASFFAAIPFIKIAKEIPKGVQRFTCTLKIDDTRFQDGLRNAYAKADELKKAGKLEDWIVSEETEKLMKLLDYMIET